MGTAHRAFGPVLTEFFLAQPRYNDWEFMRRERVGVVQYRGDRQILATDWAVDDDLQTLDRGEGVNRPPITAGSIVVKYQHQTESSDRRARAAFSRRRR